MNCRRWVLSRAAGRRLVDGRATHTLSLAETAGCPSGKPGDTSFIPGGHLRRPIGMVRLERVQRMLLGALTDEHAKTLGYPDVSALLRDWGQHHRIDDLQPVWLCSWAVLHRSRGRAAALESHA